MKQQLSFITLGVRNLERSREFYLTGLGWSALREVPGDVIFLQLNHGLVLSLWDRAAMAKELGVTPADGIAPLTLSHNVASPADVDRVLEHASRAGAAMVRPAVPAEWGGYSGYFADPDGFQWEVAHNPAWFVDDDGRVTL